MGLRSQLTHVNLMITTPITRIHRHFFHNRYVNQLIGLRLHHLTLHGENICDFALVSVIVVVNNVFILLKCIISLLWV